jgi:hypothetical protein
MDDAPPPPADQDAGRATAGGAGAEANGRGVALLLAAAAIVAAVVGARASLMTANASVAWQQAVVEEVKRAAGYVEDIRHVYGDEAQAALLYTEARFRSEELASADLPSAPAPQALVTVERDAWQEVLKALAPSTELGADPAYATREGFDVGQRLADARAQSPELVSLDPDATAAAGDDAGEKALRLVSTTPLAATAFLFGSLAQGFARRRRAFLCTAVAFLLAGIAAAFAAEVIS